MPGIVIDALAVTGALWWGGIILLAVLVAVLQRIDSRQDRKQLGDDTMAMLRAWTDEDDAAWRRLTEGDSRG